MCRCTKKTTAKMMTAARVRATTRGMDTPFLVTAELLPLEVVDGGERVEVTA